MALPTALKCSPTYSPISRNPIKPYRLRNRDWALTKEEMTNCVWIEPELVEQIEFHGMDVGQSLETLMGGSLRQSKHWG